MSEAVKVLPPVFEKAEANFKGKNRGEQTTMTRQVVRPLPTTPYTIAMDIARQMPMVFLVGFIAYKLDQRNEENAKARLSEAQDSTRTILAVVQSNTAVMERAVDAMEDVPKALDSFREAIRKP